MNAYQLSNLIYVTLFPSETKMRELLNMSVSYLHEAQLTYEIRRHREENGFSPNVVGRKFACLH